jgi:hypothetical protein
MLDATKRFLIAMLVGGPEPCILHPASCILHPDGIPNS